MNRRRRSPFPGLAWMKERLPVPPTATRISVGATVAFFVVLGVGAFNLLLLHRTDIAIGACIVAVIILVGAALGAHDHFTRYIAISVVTAGLVAQVLVVYAAFAYRHDAPGATILTAIAINHLFLFLVAVAGTRLRQIGIVAVSSVASLAVVSHISLIRIPDDFQQIMAVTAWSFLAPSILIAVSHMKGRAAQYRATQSEKTFFNSIGHEMRTPLTAILGLSRLAREQTTSDPTGEYLSEIVAAGEHLQAVMETLLLISSYRSDSRCMTLESIDVDEFVADLERRISRLIHDTGLVLSPGQRTATGCTMQADRELMMHVCSALAIARLRQADAGDIMAIFAACVDGKVLIGIDSSHETAPTRAVRWSSDDSEAVLFVIDSLLREMNGEVVIQDTGEMRGVPLIRVPTPNGRHARTSRNPISMETLRK